MIGSDGRVLLEKRLRPESSAGKWVLPASLINYGEDPLTAIGRVVKDHLGAAPERASLIDVQSYGDKHWDICFVYRVGAPSAGPLSPDIEKLDHFELSGLPPELRSDHREVLDTLKAKRLV